MKKKMKGFVVAILVMMLVLVGDGVDAQSLYSCWGGCYNQCFFGNAIDESQKLACDYSCLSSTCIPSTAADYGYYCHLACSLKRCIPFSNDGAKLEECFGWCTDLCSGGSTSLVAP